MKIKLLKKKSPTKSGTLQPVAAHHSSSLIENENVKNDVEFASKTKSNNRNDVICYINLFIFLVIIIGCSYSIWVMDMADWKRIIMFGEKKVEYATVKYDVYGFYPMSLIKCPDYNRSPSLNPANKIHMISSKEVKDVEECGTMCKNNPDCKFWHYYKQKNCSQDFSKRCQTFSNFTSVDDFHNSDIVNNMIGSRNCLVSPKNKGTNLAKGKTCNNASIFTKIDGTTCDGWMKTSLKECEEKCSKNEIPETCPQSKRNCSFVIWSNNPDWPPGWCQLADNSCNLETTNLLTMTEKLNSTNEFEEQAMTAEINKSSTSLFSPSSTSTVSTILTTDSSHQFSNTFTSKSGQQIKCKITHHGRCKEWEDTTIYFDSSIKECYEICESMKHCGGFSMDRNSCIVERREKDSCTNDGIQDYTYYAMHDCENDICEFKQNHTFKRGMKFIDTIKSKEICASYVKETIVYENATGMVWLKNGRCYAHNGYDPITESSTDTWEYPISWACTFLLPPQALLILNEKELVVAKEIVEMSSVTLDVHDDVIDVYDDHVYRQSFLTGKLEPYNEGSDINLTCVALASDSNSDSLLCKHCNVSWWIDDEIVDDSFEDISPDNLTANTLKIKKLSRKYANSQIKCIVSSSNSHKKKFQLSSLIKLQLNLKPVLVELSYNGSALSEGNEYKFICHVFGSSPTPIVTWWVDNVLLNWKRPWKGSYGRRTIYSLDRMIYLKNSTTISTLKYTPQMFQNGKKIACRAENSFIKNSAIVDETILNVTHPPVPKLSLWEVYVNDSISEERYVAFVCNITANPDFTMVTWKKDGNLIYPSHSTCKNNDVQFWNKNYYRCMSDYEIIFVKATKGNEGSYVCEALNSFGIGSSNAVNSKLVDGILVDCEYHYCI